MFTPTENLAPPFSLWVTVFPTTGHEGTTKWKHLSVLFYATSY